MQYGFLRSLREPQNRCSLPLAGLFTGHLHSLVPRALIDLPQPGILFSPSEWEKSSATSVFRGATDAIDFAAFLIGDKRFHGRSVVEGRQITYQVIC